MIGLTWILSGQRDRCIRPREARSGDDPSTSRKEARKRRQVLKIRELWSHLHGLPHQTNEARTLRGACATSRPQRASATYASGPVRAQGARTPKGLCDSFSSFFLFVKERNCLLASPFHLFIPWLKLHPSSRSLCRPGLGVHIPRYSLLPPPPPLGRSLFLPPQ